ncbi:unnamed protein product, partial [Rotaria sordida]
YRNFACSEPTLCSLDAHFDQKTPTPSLIILLNHSSSSNCQFNLKHQSSVNTTRSQTINAIYLSTQSSVKSIPLLTVMITNVDRLEKGVIRLENFEPGKE